MFTVNEVSKIAGISIRTLQYYDKIGLLPPSGFTDSGYRLYNEDSLEKLQTILLFRELEFPLKEIKKIIENPDFDREKALSEQIKLLKLRREQIDSLISLAEKLKNKEEKILDFSAFDKIKKEAPYHALTNAGHISYVELDGDTANNVEAFEAIVRCMHDAGIGYGSINHPVDRDPLCGYVGVIGEVCPRCGRKTGEPITEEKMKELRMKYRNIPYLANWKE